jgi:transposase
MRRAKLKGRQIGRRPLDIDRAAVLRHRGQGQSLGQIAKTFTISRATVSRIIKEKAERGVPTGVLSASARTRKQAAVSGSLTCNKTFGLRYRRLCTSLTPATTRKSLYI